MNSPQLKEIAAWRLMSEIIRRFPEHFRLIRTHPGGGQYDCIDLVDRKQEIVVSFNINGSLHIRGKGESKTNWDSNPEITLLHDPKEMLDQLCKVIDMKPPKKLPSSTPKVISYRFISTFLSPAIYGREQWKCDNGYLDTSGYGGGTREKWFDLFPQARKRLRVSFDDDILGEASYRFWFMLKDGQPQFCLEDTGMLYRFDGSVINLADVYAKDRRIWPVVVDSVGDVMP